MVSQPTSRSGSRTADRPVTARRVGLSLAPTELCASLVSGGRRVVRRMPLDPPSNDAASWPSLARALAELRDEIAGLPVSIALLPPLVEVRVVELPPMRDDEAERVLARAAGKFFVSARQPQLVGVTPRRSRRAAISTRVAAAAPTRLIAAILSAARDARINIATIEPAENAWAAAPAALWSNFARGRSSVVVAHAAYTDLLTIADATLDGVRRFRAGPADAELIADAVRDDVRADGSIRVAVFGANTERSAVAAALRERGLAVSTPNEGSGAAASPELLAAHFAGGRPGRGPLFRTEDSRATRRREAWRATFTIAAAAVVVFFAGAGLELWGVHRQLAATQAERARLAPQLSATLVGRNSVETVYHHLSTLTEAQRTAPQLSRAIASLSEALPDGAYLTGLRTRGDSLVLDGLADQATEAFNALEQLPGLANVRSAAPVRRQVQADSTPLERFTIAARMVHP